MMHPSVVLARHGTGTPPLEFPHSCADHPQGLAPPSPRRDLGRTSKDWPYPIVCSARGRLRTLVGVAPLAWAGPAASVCCVQASLLYGLNVATKRCICGTTFDPPAPFLLFANICSLTVFEFVLIPVSDYCFSGL